MNHVFLSALLALLFFDGKTGSAWQDGDIIFQTSLSAQSRAIQLATHSPYSHCGIIFRKGGRYYVYEAIEPVTYTPLDQWIARGKGKHYVVKRLKQASGILTPPVLDKCRRVAESFKGRHYDRYFDWTDDKMYCSELIWKTYKRGAGIEVGTPGKLKDFDLTSAAVRQKMRERYGTRIPLQETVISPASIFNSPLLMTVGSN